MDLAAEAAVREAFRAADKEGDGCLSAAELTYVLEQIGCEKTQIARVLTAAGADGRGRVDINVWLNCIFQADPHGMPLNYDLQRHAVVAQQETTSTHGRLTTRILPMLVWLSPAAYDLLLGVSKLLHGSFPCQAAQFTCLLRDAVSSEYSGLLSDPSLKSDLARQIEDDGLGEISDGVAVLLVDSLCKVLEMRYEIAQRRAAEVVKLLPAGLGSGLDFSQVARLLPHSDLRSDALRRDWVLWHSVACANQKSSAASEGFVRDRVALAACAGEGPTADFVLALHVLENLDAYVSWELSLHQAFSKERATCSVAVFDDSASLEAATRRVLLHALLLPEIAAATAEEVTLGGSLELVLAAHAESARAAAILPRYAAPIRGKVGKEQKEPKAKRVKKTLDK